MDSFPGYKIFPIKSETSCLLKWSWSTINLENGTTSSCHRAGYDAIDPDNFSNFHNIDAKIQARDLMQQGKWPGRGCEYCARVERTGGTSDRMMALEREHTIDKIPPELLKDPTATHVTPTILEVYFNNTCNLSCIYCGPALSSKINDELRKFGEMRVSDFSQTLFLKQNSKYDKMVGDLWKYLAEDDRYKIIRHFHVLGGEPLLQKELDQSIDFWDTHPNPNLTINLITNLMLPHNAFVKKMDRFPDLIKRECIYKLEITASIDCWGPEQEYIRYGIDLDLWRKNFEYLVRQPWVHLSIHSCINALSIKSMPDLMTHINQWNKHRDQQINFSYDLPIGKDWMYIGLHPASHGPGIFDRDFETIISLMPENNQDQITARKQMQSIAQYIKTTTRDPEKIDRLRQYLTEIDHRRGTSWISLFPWLI